MRIFAFLVICLFAQYTLDAQDPVFKVEVSSDSILVGNYFELVFTIENAEGKFDAPNLSEFDIIGGPNTSSSFSMINGRVTQSASYSYYLKPRDIGVFTIPPAFYETDETTLETIPIDIIAVPNPDGIIQQPHRPTQRYNEVFPDWSQMNRKPTPQDTSKKSKRKKKIF